MLLKNIGMGWVMMAVMMVIMLLMMPMVSDDGGYGAGSGVVGNDVVMVVVVMIMLMLVVVTGGVDGCPVDEDGVVNGNVNQLVMVVIVAENLNQLFFLFQPIICVTKILGLLDD